MLVVDVGLTMTTSGGRGDGLGVGSVVSQTDFLSISLSMSFIVPSFLGLSIVLQLGLNHTY